MPLPRQKMNVELANGEEFMELEAINPDMIRYETEGHKFGLSKDLQDNPMSYMTFLAWAALKRMGKYEGDWPTFKTRDCLVIEPIDEETAGNVDPTPAAVESNSPLP